MSLRAAAATLGVEVGPEAETRLRQLIALLQDWNARYNLTAIRDVPGIELKHIVDSLAPAAHGWSACGGQQPRTLLDVGSGAGFPALPLAIVYPRTSVTALESSRKKCDFIAYAAEQLGVELRVVHGRAESEGQQPVLRERFDLVVARSVAYLPVLAEYCLPFTRVGGCFIALKSEGLDEEIVDGLAAIEELGGVLREPIPYHIPGLSGTRWLLVAEKVSRTLETYPREPGMPKRSPISQRGGASVPKGKTRTRRTAAPRG